MNNLERELILKHLDNLTTPEEQLDVHKLLAEDQEARQFLQVVAEQAIVVADLERVESRSAARPTTNQVSPTSTPASSLFGSLTPWLTLASIILLVAGGYYFSNPKQVEPFATISALNGQLIWTGDEGLLRRDLNIGDKLNGGTLKVYGANAWTRLSFDDGSVVTVVGQSEMTISNGVNRELHLNNGRLSATVAKQEPGKLMMIHTPTAKLEVLGTQLNVSSAPLATTLAVNEGKVRMTRLIDGVSCEVPAQHRAVASLKEDSQFGAVPFSDPVFQWASDFSDPSYFGKLMPSENQLPQRMAALPLNWKDEFNKPIVLDVVAFSVDNTDSSGAVLIQQDSTFVIRGRISETNPESYFVVSTQFPGGGFSGKFYIPIHHESLKRNENGVWETTIALRDFKLSEAETKRTLEEENADLESRLSAEKLPESPMGFELIEFVGVSMTPRSELEIISVHLLTKSNEDTTN